MSDSDSSKFYKDEMAFFSESIQEIADIGAWSFDFKNNLLFWTNQTYRIHEVTPGEEIDVANAINFYAPHERERITKYVTNCIEKGIPYDDEFDFITAKGNKIIVRAIGRPVFDETGQVELIRGIFQNITERVLKDREIREKDQERMNLLNSIAKSSIVAFTDTRGIITEVNDRFCEISKYSREELIGSDHRILNSGEHSKQFFQNLWTQIRSGHSWVGEIKNKAKDGSYYWVNTTINPTYNIQGEMTGFIAIRNDITEQKHIEEQLNLEKLKIVQSSKLATVGEMASGVAHEINNPLAIIQASTEIIEKKAISEEKKAKNIQMILDWVRRIARIVNGLRKFSRASCETEFDSLSLKYIFSDVENLITAKSKRYHVPVEFILDEDVSFEGDEIQIEQILINLIVNAIDQNQGEKDPWVKVFSYSDEDQVHIIVQDSGEGIDKSDLAKIFNPFYTTKEIGKGTGLGLSISRGIANDHGGNLIYQLIDERTSFILSLPLKHASKKAS